MAKLSLFLAAPIAAAGFIVPAAAEDNGERRSVTVRYDDLNLASASGRDRLTTRIRFAVRAVCDSRLRHRQPLSERAVAKECEDAVMADANVKLAGLFNGSTARLAGNRPIVVSAP